MRLEQLADRLESGETCARELAEASLANIRQMLPDGGPVFVQVDEGQVLADADYIDRLRKAGRAPSRFAGIPFSVKDLFDQAGVVTRAGSVVLENDAPASRDAEVVARLKAYGFVALGRTNMTEFAYSGVGLNPHYGTPKSIWDRKCGRIPGGSTAGGGVSVADGTVPLAIGTDTGGSCRVPAAYNSIVGYKSSFGRVPMAGVYPLAVSFDTVGPLARSVSCCAQADAIMAGDWDGRILPRDVSSLRLGIPTSLVLDDLDDEVARVFEKTVSLLSRAGAKIIDVEFPELAALPEINASGGIGSVEAFALHGQRIADQGERFDQRVKVRILSGEKILAHQMVTLEKQRRAMIVRMNELMSGFDGFIMPTCPMIPPAIAELDDDAAYGHNNFRSLRNTFVANFLDRCAISLPVNESGKAPVGLMIMAPLMQDQSLFATSRAVENCIRT